MSDRGINFANAWVTENINAGVYAEEGQRHPETADAVARLVAEAREAGITREEIEEDMGDLDDFIDNAFEEATDVEVERLSNREP